MTRRVRPKTFFSQNGNEGSFPLEGGGGNPYNGLYGEAPPERGTFFRLQVMKRYGFHELKYMKGSGNLSFRYLKGPLI